MVKKRITVQCIIIFMAVIYCVNMTMASEYVPWKKGDYGVYVDSMNNVTKAEIDRTIDEWVHYTEFAGLGPLWVKTTKDDERVFIRQTITESAQLLVDFNKQEGSVGKIQIDPCNTGSVEIISKNEKINIAAGAFENVVLLSFETSCADSGVIQSWFAPGVGCIQWESSNISGPVSNEMIRGTIGGSSYPKGLLVSSSFPDPSVTIDMEPPVDPDRSPKTINAYLIITNSTGRDLTYTFNSGQLFEITIIDSEGKVVSQWSRGMGFTDAIQTLILSQGESWTFGGEVELSTEKGETLPAGNYTIAIEMTSAHDEETDHQSGSERIRITAPLSILYAL